MHKCRKVNNTKWPKKTDETNHFKIKTREGFDLTILKVKQIHYKRIEFFTIRMNPKSIATYSSNLLTRSRASSESTDSFSSLYLHQCKPPCLWLWDPTQRFQITISFDLDATTMFYLCLIVNFAPIDFCVVRRYKTSQKS